MAGVAAPPFATLLRVYIPFALAYVAAYLFRGVNAVLFPYLERDLGIGAGDLGLLTAAYFFIFAGCQPVLGIALDRFGPRNVQVVLMLVAALGALVFSLSQGLAQLVVGRALIGLGCAAGLMGAIKAITMWFPQDRWPLMTGLHMAAGGVGYMAATRPVEWSLALTTWQGLFFWLAAFCVVVAVLMLLVVPERHPGGKPGTLRQQVSLTWLVLRDAFFWRIIPLLTVQQIAYIAILFLWIGPWLRDVAGIADRNVRADLQLATAFSMTVGFMASGVVSNALIRRGISAFATANAASALFAVICLWLALAPPSGTWAVVPWLVFAFVGAFPIQYMSIMAGAFPVEIAGRVSTSSNLVVFTLIFAGQWGIGAVLDLWPRSSTGYAADGYGWTLGCLAMLQFLMLLWMVYWRPLPLTRRTRQT